MSTQVQFRRGTTTQNNAFTGANGEISIDTDVKTIRLHDGTTGGGASIMMNTTTAQTALNKTFSTGSVWTGNSVGLAYGGTGSSLTGVAGAVAYSGSSGLGLSAAGTSGQILVSGGTNSPVWVNASSVTAGNATTATSASNITGGSAGQLLIQSDTSVTSFITAGASGTFLQSAGAGYSPTWAAGQVTLGSTAVSLGGTVTTFSGLTNLIMGNGSYGTGSISGPGITGSGPWTVTVTGITSTTGLSIGQEIKATAGTGSLHNSPTSVVIASIVSSTSITVTVTGGTTPTAGTITGITVLGYLQVPVGTNAQRSWVPATGMVRYNSDTVSFEGYSSGAWSSLGGVSSVDKYTYIRAETSAGASNGDLDFFAEDSAGTAATQVGQWNRTNLKDYTGTLVGTQTTQNVFNATATTVNAFGASTAITVGATTGTHTIRNATVTLANATSLNINGASPAIATTSTTASVFNSTVTTLNIGGAATTLSIGAATGTATINNAEVVITGNLTVNGTTTTVNSTTLTVDDKNIELGSVASPTDITAAGGGITLKGATDKVIDWNATTGWRLEDDIATRRLFTGTTSSTTATSILAVASATYRSGVIEMQVVNSTSYRICRLMFVHDGTTVTLSENYVVGLDVQTATTNTTFTASISSGTLTIFATAASGTSTIKGECTLFKV